MQQRKTNFVCNEFSHTFLSTYDIFDENKQTYNSKGESRFKEDFNYLANSPTYDFFWSHQFSDLLHIFFLNQTTLDLRKENEVS